MKKHSLMIGTMLSLIVMVATASVNGQSRSHFMKINIPFDFAIRDETLPAGEYVVTRASSVKPEVLLIRSVKGGTDVYVLTSNVRAKTGQSESRLVFRRYGDQYFLAQVWVAEDNLGRELPTSHRQRIMEREMARNTSKRQPLTVFAHRRLPD